MIVDHGNDNVAIYLERLIGVDWAIEQGTQKTCLKKAMIGYSSDIAPRLRLSCSSACLGNLRNMEVWCLAVDHTNGRWR